MVEKRKNSYGYAALMGILTVIICMAVADGLIGIRGTVQNYVDLGNGYHSFDLAINDPTGRCVFWPGIIGLPSSGWISIGEGLEPVGVMILFWLIQVFVLLVITVIRFGVRKLKEKGNDRGTCV